MYKRQGSNTVVVDDTSTGETLAGVTPFPIDGAMPPLSSSAKTPFTRDQPCETQDPPDLRAVTDGLGPAPRQSMGDAEAVPTSGTAADIFADAETALSGLGEAAQAAEDGDEDEAKDLEEQAMKDLQDFYESYGD